MSKELSIAVSVENLSKVFDLRKQHHDTFGQKMTRFFNSVLNTKKNISEKSFLTALDKISFQLNQGDTLGIIGENGAGKSTLLKILGSVTPPTTGRVEFNGRVASILDVGTGFHPELSGRENVYLSGALMGMRKEEIAARFDQIIEFSGIEPFIDVAVKHYSNGMFLRLAFSVITHLDADIILLDEVLSVGDALFRVKSFNKIRELSQQGKTLLLASHDLGSVSAICTKCLLLEKGKMKVLGRPMDLVQDYMEENINKSESENAPENEHFTAFTNEKKWTNLLEAPGDEGVKIKQISVQGLGKPTSAPIQMEDALLFEVIYQKKEEGSLNLSIILNSQVNLPVLSITPFRSENPKQIVDNTARGRYLAKCVFPANLFNRGIYTLDLVFVSPDHAVEIVLSGILNFKIHYESDPKALFKYDGNFPGPLFPIADWKVEQLT